MRMWMYGFPITEEELKNIIGTLDMNEALELVEIDEDGDFHFERNAYGTHY